MGINDPVVPNESQARKDKRRAELEQQIKEYLKKGGKISTEREIRFHNLVSKKKPKR